MSQITLFANRKHPNKAYYHFTMDGVSRGWVQTFSKK